MVWFNFVQDLLSRCMQGPSSHFLGSSPSLSHSHSLALCAKGGGNDSTVPHFQCFLHVRRYTTSCGASARRSRRRQAHTHTDTRTQTHAPIHTHTHTHIERERERERERDRGRQRERAASVPSRYLLQNPNRVCR